VIEPTRARRVVAWLRRYGPYLVAAIAVVALLRRYRLAEVMDAMGKGNALAVFPVALLFAINQIVLVAMWDLIFLRAFVPTLRWWDVMRAKAGCAVLQVIAYAANQGAYGAWVARAIGSGVRNAIGLILVSNSSDMFAGLTVIGACLWISDLAIVRPLRWIAPILAIALLLALVVPARRPLDLHVESGIVRVVRGIPRGRLVVQAVGRIVNVTAVGIAAWFAARAFGLHIPLTAMVVYMPIVMVVGALPVNVAGLGVVQGAWLLFLPWATGPQILAFQFVWQFSLMLAQVVRGLPFVRRVMVEVAEGKRLELGRAVVPAAHDLA
jgi:hypothetical protein